MIKRMLLVAVAAVFAAGAASVTADGLTTSAPAAASPVDSLLQGIPGCC
jgi:hypothetical protein